MTENANVDPAELAKFGDLAHHWWDPESDLTGPLHRINPLRVEWLERVCGGFPGKQAVDVGCGGGILSEALAVRGAGVVGIDLSEKALAVAKLHRYESGVAVDYRLVSAEALAVEAPARFDIVACMELLEHVPEPSSTVAACAALVKPGGIVAFSTLNRNPKSYALAILGAEYLMNLLPRGTHDWSRFVRPAELAAFGRRAGLSLVELTGLVYNPLTRAFRLDPSDVDVNYLAAFARDD